MEKNKNIYPTKYQLEFLTLAYDRFYDNFETVMKEEFWNKNSKSRFVTIRETFEIFSELLSYEPVKWSLTLLEQTRPKDESYLLKRYIPFIRNLLVHFPFFDSWNDVYFTKELVSWQGRSRSINRFINENMGREVIKYRLWEETPKIMTYLTISFPKDYIEKKKIYLKDLISEKEGVKFSLVLMKKILELQVEFVKN